MGYVVVNEDGLQFGHLGKAWRQGATIGEGELPRALVEKLLAEGAIVEKRPSPQPSPVGPGDGTLTTGEGAGATAGAVALAAREEVERGAGKGTGSRGRVTVADVRAYLDGQEGARRAPVREEGDAE